MTKTCVNAPVTTVKTHLRNGERDFFFSNDGLQHVPEWPEPPGYLHQGIFCPMSAYMPRILLIDDDESAVSIVCEYLARFNFTPCCARNEAEMWRRLEEQQIDLIVFDPALRGVDGLTLMQALRERVRLPIVILTGRCDLTDRIVGLEMGADDYVGKPFEPREFIARIRAVLRRTTGAFDPRAMQPKDDTVRFAGWSLHCDGRRLVSPTGTAKLLSNAEYLLLSTFLKMPRQIISREDLMLGTRGMEMHSSVRGIDLLVSRLRQKLANGPDNSALIKTVRGVGYMFDPEPQHGPTVLQSS